MDKGDRVVCINDDFQPWARDTYDQLPVKDRVYTIREVNIGRKNLSSPSDSEIVIKLLLEELQNAIDFSHAGGEELGFDSTRFAPLLEDYDEEAKEEVVEIGAGNDFKFGGGSY